MAINFLFNIKLHKHLILISIIGWAINTNAQNTSDILLMDNHYKKTSDTTITSNAFSPIKSVILMPLWLYKQFISEQLSASCEFHPSCSIFCKESIKHYGPLKGILLGADRLTRCHGNAHSENQSYLKKKHNNNIENPPSFYSF